MYHPFHDNSKQQQPQQTTQTAHGNIALYHPRTVYSSAGGPSESRRSSQNTNAYEVGSPLFSASGGHYLTGEGTPLWHSFSANNYSNMMLPPSGNSPTSAPNRGGAQYTLIANVPYDTVRQDLVVEFRKYGRVELAMVVCDEASRHPHKEWTSTAGYAFVRFSQRSEAAAAIQAASLGLITIRNTRVRADWARKDSYAKRGRVSPTQGAPLLGPFGIPDGIEQLRLSMEEMHRNGGAAAPASMKGAPFVEGLNRLQSLPHMAAEDPGSTNNIVSSTDLLSQLRAATFEHPPSFKEAFESMRETGGNATLVGSSAPLDVFSRGGDPNVIDNNSSHPQVVNPQVEGSHFSYHSATHDSFASYQRGFSNKDSASAAGGSASTSVLEGGGPLPLSSAEDHEAQQQQPGGDEEEELARVEAAAVLPPLWLEDSDDEDQCNGVASNAARPTSGESSSSAVGGASSSSGLEDVLSPTSRGLLAQALRDVASDPNELLQRALERIPSRETPKAMNFYPPSGTWMFEGGNNNMSINNNMNSSKSSSSISMEPPPMMMTEKHHSEGAMKHSMIRVTEEGLGECKLDGSSASISSSSSTSSSASSSSSVSSSSVSSSVSGSATREAKCVDMEATADSFLQAGVSANSSSSSSSSSSRNNNNNRSPSSSSPSAATTTTTNKKIDNTAVSKLPGAACY